MERRKAPTEDPYSKETRHMARLLRTEENITRSTDFYWDYINKLREGRGFGGNKSKLVTSKKEEAIFTSTCSPGVNFDSYDDIKVKRSGPNISSIPIINDFKRLYGIVPEFLEDNLDRMKHVKPTPVQRHAIPVGLFGEDMMCCAQTGSGKTLAYLIPVVAALDKLPSRKVGGKALPHALVFAPTRELALQIHQEALKLTFRSRFQVVAIYGGAETRPQLAQLARGCDLVIATPGRLSDFFCQDVVSLKFVRLLVLDEADRMLDMGFGPQMRKLILDSDMVSKDERQTFMFSATFPLRMKDLAQDFMRKHVWIAIGAVGDAAATIRQRILRTSGDREGKLRILLRSLDKFPGRTLVFAVKRETVVWLGEHLPSDRIGGVACIHGNMKQPEREAALSAFRAKGTRILIATNVAARGLDIPQVEHVINFDLPEMEEEFDDYIHKIGRTGRVGNTGIATSFYVPGFEDGTGNGKIAMLLYKTLEASNQKIPKWFYNLDEIQEGLGLKEPDSSSSEGSVESSEGSIGPGFGGRGRGRGRGRLGRGRGGARGGRGGRGRGGDGGLKRKRSDGGSSERPPKFQRKLGKIQRRKKMGIRALMERSFSDKPKKDSSKLRGNDRADHFKRGKFKFSQF